MTTFQPAADPSAFILANGEALLRLADALRPCGAHPATGSRWCARGVTAKDGRRVRLEHVRVGAKLKTSAEAVARFLSALSGTPETSPPAPSQAERRRAVDRAEAELVAAGA